jgi:hypothetical protein
MARALAARVPEGVEQTIKRVPCYYDRGSYLVPDEENPKSEARNPKQIRNPKSVIQNPKSLLLPTPGPDLAWYKWKDGQYLGYDWRNPRAAAGFERHERRKQRDRARKRVRPRRRGGSGSLEFRGWRWICPRCRDAARVMYLPLRPRALVGLNEISNVEIRNANEERRNPQSKIRSSAELAEVNPNSPEGFACHRCHRVLNYSVRGLLAWNALVAYLSGGLLYGREVDRPAWLTSAHKRENPGRAAARAARIAELLERHWSPRRIAQELGERYWRVVYLARKSQRRTAARPVPPPGPKRGERPAAAHSSCVDQLQLQPVKCVLAETAVEGHHRQSGRDRESSQVRVHPDVWRSRPTLTDGRPQR